MESITSGKKVSYQQALEIEQRLNTTLPVELVQLHVIHGVGRADSKYECFNLPDGCSLLSDDSRRFFVDRYFSFLPTERYQSELEEKFNEYKDRIPEGALPIAFTDFGDLILISVIDDKFGQVFFWDHEAEWMERNTIVIAQSFSEYISRLTASPFSQPDTGQP